MPRRLLTALCLTLFTTACSTPQPIEPSTGDAIVYVVGRGWHTDIGLPSEEITGSLTALKNAYPSATVLVLGFGERQFLVNRQKSVGAMLNALLPSQSALLLTALRASPQAAFGDQNVVTLHVSHEALRRIETRIWQEFELSSVAKPTRLAEGPYPGSTFYAAAGTYDAFFTCNTWTAETLRAGGLPMPAGGVLFSGQVMGSARWIAAHQTPPH
jgi:uncharacterized protein (TIGR02117 family)